MQVWLTLKIGDFYVIILVVIDRIIYISNQLILEIEFAYIYTTWHVDHSINLHV